MNRTLTCYAYGHGKMWEAICVDLDLAVDGVSLDDVKRKLTGVMHTYIEDASKEDEKTRVSLLNRKAPLWLRCKLRLMHAWYATKQKKSNDGYEAFGMQCAA